MALSTPLPTNFNQNNLYIGYMQMFCNTDGYGWYCYEYLGGDPSNIDVNWILENGLLAGDPDTTLWTPNQIGAKWINVSEMKYKGWNGTQIIVLGSIAISGSQILIGSGIPSNNLGDNGDFYLNTINGDYYKKVSSVWGASIGNLTGPQGIQGIPGSSVTPNMFGSVYHVYPGGSFATIQAAINQAVADGHISAENSFAFIIIHGKWTEDIILKDGISLIGASEGKLKDYTSRITGQLTYTPQSTNPLDTNVTIANLFILAGTGKNAIKITGANKGRIFLKKCYIDKTGGTDDIILMNGHNSSVIEADDIDGNITSASAGCTIYNILNGTFKSFNSCLLSSAYPGKILNCGANGVVNAQIVSSCTGSDAITIAVGGKVTLALSSITNNQANSNGANIVAGGQLISLDTLWNVPSGTGKAIFGVAGSVWVYSLNTFVANKNYSSSIGLGAIAWSTTPIAT